MRTAPYINALWSKGGPFIGADAKAHTVVTIQSPFTGDFLHTVNAGNYADRGEPVRWWQSLADDQTEIEVPNVKSVVIDRSLDQDAASCTIVLFNQWMYQNNAAPPNSPQLGQPGYFTANRGASADAIARWGTVANEWANAFIPNAVLRTRQGYGGYGKTWQQAVTDGNLILTGVWLVDEVTTGTDGTLSVKCRDMAKLLIEQQLYLPLIPADHYPLKYFRWTYLNDAVRAGSRSTTSGTAAVGARTISYSSSSGDVWYNTYNFEIHGHFPLEATDNSTDSYWLSLGNSSGDAPWAYDWLEYDVGSDINAVYVNPWSGNYQCLAGETVVMTLDRGHVPIKDLAGKTAVLLTQTPSGPSRWVDAAIRSFGSQQLIRVNLTRNGVKKTIRATAGHRWILRKYRGKNLATIERTTNELKSGDRLQAVKPPTVASNATPCSFGIAAGLVFGDGTTTQQGCRVDLYGECRTLEDHFGPARQRRVYRLDPGKVTITRSGKRIVGTGQELTQIDALPYWMKWRPSIDENSRFLYGWVAGYFAADGCVDKIGGSTLTSVVLDDLTFTRRVCDRLGIITYAPTKMRRFDEDGVEIDPAWHLRFAPSTLRPEFFLQEKHRNRWLAVHGDKLAKHRNRTERLWWTVESVEKTDDVEEVFCAEVPDTHTFALEDNILTGNCFVSVMVDGVWQGTDTIPYDYAALAATEPAVDTGANIPYIATYGIPWETPAFYNLPGLYHADKIRVTFHNGVYTDYGPWHYRAGVREFAALVSADGSQTQQTVTYQPFFAAGDTAADRVGYLTVDTFADVDAFGDARSFPQTGGSAPNGGDGIAGCAVTHTGQGYYLLTSAGRIYTYGDAVFRGCPFDDGFQQMNGVVGQCNEIRLTPSGNGYWCLEGSGTLFHYGDATNLGNLPYLAPNSSYDYPSMDANPTLQGLWVLRSDGVVIGHGPTVDSARWYGNWIGTNPMVDQGKAICIRRDKAATGYWIMTWLGQFQHFGTAPDNGSVSPIPDLQAAWTEKFWEFFPQDDDGYDVMRGDGTIIQVHTDYFFGSPIPGGGKQLRVPGNYSDYSDIIRDLVLWSGWYLYDPNLPSNETPPVFGNIESTGAYAPEPLPDTMFDKKPVIDAIHQLKEVVGYNAYVDDQGGVRFESANIWGPGNFDELGNHLDVIPEIDEKIQLTQYQTVQTDDPIRSEIIISSEDPDQHSSSTITTKFVPSTAAALRGMMKPAMWVNGFFQNPDEQRVMAELIALRIHFAQRTGNITCVANPAIGIDCQVRVWERISGESYIHYVRAVHTEHDLETGLYSMTLTTNWLGSESEWAITDTVPPGSPGYRFKISSYGLHYAQTSPADGPSRFLLDYNFTDPITPVTPTTQPSIPTETPTTPTTTPDPNPPPTVPVDTDALAASLGFATRNLTVSDEFDGTAGSSPDTTRWDAKSFRSGGSSANWNGFNNCSLNGNSCLDVAATRNLDGSWNSTWLSGKHAYSGTRFVVVRAKIPGGNGTWPAPAWEWTAPFGAPPGPELDVIEQLGREPSAYHATLHYWDSSGGDHQNSSTITTPVTLSAAFHDYGAAVYNDRVDFYFDGAIVHTVRRTDFSSTWVFDVASVVMNIDLDMGGSWAGPVDFGLPSPVHMLVDFVRVYQ